MSDYYNHAWDSGQWLAGTKVINAKFSSRCVGCRQTINVGEQQANVFNNKDQKGWMHARCMQALGVHGFVGKHRYSTQ